MIDIFKGETTPVEVARQHDLTVAEVERWVEEAERNMENGFRTRPKDVREQYEKELQQTREALGDTHLQIYALKISAPARRRGELVRSLQAQLQAEGHCVSLSKLCSWLGVPRRSIYYKPRSRPKTAAPALVERVRVAMQRSPTYGNRRLLIVLGENKKPIQRILQIKGWQVRRRPQGFRPRARTLPSITHRPDERWATDICHVWCGRDRRGALAAVIDCCTREILGWRLSSSGATATA